MQNLVKIQEDLKNLPLQAVMSYVEGRNPMVPPYLALTELNRRKQIQKSSDAQQPQASPTVKDQVTQASGLMALQNQRAQAGAENMMQRAANIPQPGAVPPNAPVQGQPAQMPTVQAAEGGLMNARMNPTMFNRQNFAGGGIVAFSGKDRSDVEDEELTEEEKKFLAENKYLQRSRAVANLPSAIVEGIQKYNPITGSAFREGIKNIINESPEDQAARFRKASMRPEGAPSAVPTATERNVAAEARTAKELADFDTATAQFEKERAAKVTPPTAVDPALANVSIPKPPVVAKKEPAGITQAANIYDKEADNLLKLQERFGVKQQPNVESDKMVADLKQKIMAQRQDQGLEALGKAMAKGAQGKKWYQAAAGFGEGYFDTTAQQRKLNNEQDQAFTNLQLAKEKEDDARRRGDVKSVQEAVERTRKAEIDAKNAESNRIQATKPSQFAEQVKLYTENPALYAKMFPKENPLVVAAAKEYFEKEQLYKKDYPTVQDYLAAKGLTMGGGGASTASAAPKEGDKAKSNSGRDIIFKNGKWEYA